MDEPTPILAVVVSTGASAVNRSACLAGVRAQSARPAAIEVVEHGAPLDQALRSSFGPGIEWLWLVRDDGIHDRGALAALLAASTAVPDLPPPALLASKFLTRDGAIEPARLPRPAYKPIERVVAAYERGLQAIRWADFGSLLVSRAAIDAHGFPRADLGAAESETEYTARILREDIGFLVPGSVLRPGPATADRVPAAGAYLGDTVRMLRSGSWALGEGVGLGVARGARALGGPGRRR